MALGWPEKICRGEKLPYRKFLKQTMNRKMRRLAKQNPEAAPCKGRHWGWSN